MKIMIFVLHNLWWRIKNIHRVDKYCHLITCKGALGGRPSEGMLYLKLFLEGLLKLLVVGAVLRKQQFMASTAALTLRSHRMSSQHLKSISGQCGVGLGGKRVDIFFQWVLFCDSRGKNRVLKRHIISPDF